MNSGGDAGERRPEYSTEVAYLRTFTNDLSPAMLRFVAALNGFAPPPAEGFDYCELGCGNGDTITALAAANPGARFVGVDISPEHVAFADRLAARGGLTNVRFLERDFEALRGQELPLCDFICAHGVLSWVSPAKRKTMMAVAASMLKPGGLLHVSYNALPGWAGLEPLRRLLLDGAASGGGDALDKAQRGVSLAKLLADAGAAYFDKNPNARAMIGTMLSSGLPYVVHEYLQPHWHPMYVSEVAREMSEYGLYYVGQLPLFLNFRDLAIGPVLVELLRGVSDRLTFESLKDYAINELFRRDVYVKGAVGRADATARKYLEETPFGTFRGADKIGREVRFPHSTLSLGGPLFDVVIGTLSRQAMSVLELTRLPELTAMGVGPVREAVTHLALGNQVMPMLRSTSPASAPGKGLFHLPMAYNRMILEQPLTMKTPLVLAAPAAGMGLAISMLEAVCLRILTGVPPAERPAWIRAFVERHDLKLHVAEKLVQGAAEQAAVLAGELWQFCELRAPKLIELGILEEVR